MKLCVMGNSHLGALKLGWDEDAGHAAGVSVDFFPLGRNTYRHTKLDGTEIVPTKPELVEKLANFSGVSDRIAVPDYDAFVICGLASGGTRVLRYLQNHGIAGETSDRAQIVSYQLFQDAWDAYFESTPVPHLLGLLRQVTDKPVLLLPRPLLSAAVAEGDDARARFYTRLTEAEEGAYTADLLDRLMARHLDARTFLLRQPVETTEAGVMTRKEFSVGSARLRDADETHDEDDVNHMNADYGAIIMAQVLEVLGVTLQARSTMTEPTE